MNIRVLLAACMCAAVAAPASAAASAMRSAKGPLSSFDREFVTKAAQGGMTEVALGKLAAQRASSPAVKQFGRRMVKDHSKANAALKSVAKRNGVALPTDLGAEGNAMKAKMSKLSGHAFDMAYVNDMVDDHKKDVGEFTKASAQASNKDVKAFAKRTLPTLKTHLKMIQGIQAKHDMHGMKM